MNITNSTFFAPSYDYQLTDVDIINQFCTVFPDYITTIIIKFFIIFLIYIFYIGLHDIFNLDRFKYMPNVKQVMKQAFDLIVFGFSWIIGITAIIIRYSYDTAQKIYTVMLIWVVLAIGIILVRKKKEIAKFINKINIPDDEDKSEKTKTGDFKNDRYRKDKRT